MNQHPLTVLYQDDCLLAVDKPSGVLVHRGWGRDDTVLVDLVKEFLKEKTAYPLHRIDRGTSGVVLFARNPEIAAKIGQDFLNGTVQKRYLALVRGIPPESGLIDHPIPRREKGPRVDAITQYHRLASATTEPRSVSLVLAIPKTGRLHQVRRHLKHIDHPVIGDANYGKGVINREMAARYGLRRLALHALGLRFLHPETQRETTICAAMPPNLREPLVRMGFEDNLCRDVEGVWS